MKILLNVWMRNEGLSACLCVCCCLQSVCCVAVEGHGWEMDGGEALRSENELSRSSFLSNSSSSSSFLISCHLSQWNSDTQHRFRKLRKRYNELSSRASSRSGHGFVQVKWISCWATDDLALRRAIVLLRGWVWDIAVRTNVFTCNIWFLYFQLQFGQICTPQKKN